MERRKFLGTFVLGLSIASAGCNTLLGDTKTLADPSEHTEDDGMEKHLRFESEGQRILEFSLDQRSTPAAPRDPFPLRLYLSHRSSSQRNDETTTIDQFQIDLRAPSASVDPPADIYLRSPAGALSGRIDFGQIEDRWTRIDAPNPGKASRGTIVLETIVNPRGQPANEVGVKLDVELSETGTAGTTYHVDAQTVFRPVIEE